MLTYSTFLVVLCLTSIESANRSLHENLSKSDVNGSKRSALAQVVCNLVQCVGVKAIHVHTSSRSTTEITEKLLKCLNSHQSAPIFVKALESVFDGGRDSSSMTSLHIFIVSRLAPEDVQRATRFAGVEPLTRKNQKYIFVFERATPKEIEGTLHLLFKAMRRKKILDVVAVFKIDQIFSYTFLPFKGNGETGSFRLKPVSCPQPYFDKLRDLNGYRLKVSLFYDTIRAIPLNDSPEFRGVDGFVAQAFGRYVNASIEYITPMGNESEYKTSFLDVARERVHIAFNLRFVRNSSKLVERTFPYAHVPLYLVVPKAQKIPIFLHLFRTMDNTTWIAILTIFPVVVIAAIYLQRTASMIPLEFDHHLTNTEMCLLFLSFFLGNSVDHMTNLNGLRLLLAAWLLFGYLSTSAFFAKLESTLVQPEFGKDLNSLEDISKIHTNIYIVPGFIHLVEESLGEEIFNNLKGKLRRLKPNSFDSLASMPRNSSFILRDDKARYFVRQTFDTVNMQPAYHIMKDNLAFIPKSYIVPVGSPLLRKLDRFLLALRESGLMKYWERSTFFRATIEKKLVQDPEEEFGEDDYDYDDDDEDNEEDEPPKVVLTLELLQSAFYLWIMGISVSITAFIVEKCVFKKQKFNK